MTAFARLRDIFLPGTEPDRAIFCTYGFDARFFETEVLPAMLPQSLTLDREAGSPNGYLNSADAALQKRDVSVFYDHLLGDGPELLYECWPVDVFPQRFHAKLIVLDYGDRIRVMVGSANLTRSAWTSLLELWVVEDLEPGVPHDWAEGLRRFLAHLATRIPEQQLGRRAGIEAMLEAVPDSRGDERIVSTWDEPLLDAFFASLPNVTKLNVVSPFFEGSDGPGVFDALTKQAPTARGELYASVSADDEELRLSGPPAKLTDLFATDRWRLHGVRAVWDGDDEGAPLRQLHGKLLTATHADGSRMMIGSANFTRAALLGRAATSDSSGVSNVELVLLRDGSRQASASLLPQADPVDFDRVHVVDSGDPTGEDEEQAPGPDRYVISATYRAETMLLEVLVSPDAPALTVRYDGRTLDEVKKHVLLTEVELGIPRYVVVDDGTETGMAPFTVVDPERMLPRGTSHSVDLETFLELLAGGQELPLRFGESHVGNTGPGDPDLGIVGGTGAIPWRRYLGAVRGLGTELERECNGLRGLKFVLENPIRMAGLLDHLNEAYDRHRFTAADLLYALYELEQELTRVRDLTATDDCLEIVENACLGIGTRRDELLSLTGNTVAQQMDFLQRADAKR